MCSSENIPNSVGVWPRRGNWWNNQTKFECTLPGVLLFCATYGHWSWTWSARSKWCLRLLVSLLAKTRSYMLKCMCMQDGYMCCMRVFIWNITIALYQICICNNYWFTVHVFPYSLSREEYLHNNKCYLNNLEIEMLEIRSQDVICFGFGNSMQKFLTAYRPALTMSCIIQFTWAYMVS